MRPQVGDAIPPFVRTTDLILWSRYAAVNDEFVLIHLDDDHSRSVGLPSAIGMGNLQTAYMHNVLRDWGGPDSRVRRVVCQHRAQNLKNDTLTCTGTVTAVDEEPGLWVVSADLVIKNQRGEIVSPGSGVVEIPIPGAG